MCWKSCVKTEISFWSKYTTWQLLKDIWDSMNNYVHIRKWLGKPCIEVLSFLRCFHVITIYFFPYFTWTSTWTLYGLNWFLQNNMGFYWFFSKLNNKLIWVERMRQNRQQLIMIFLILFSQSKIFGNCLVLKIMLRKLKYLGI